MLKKYFKTENRKLEVLDQFPEFISTIPTATPEMVNVEFNDNFAVSLGVVSELRNNTLMINPVMFLSASNKEILFRGSRAISTINDVDVSSIDMNHTLTPYIHNNTRFTTFITVRTTNIRIDFERGGISIPIKTPWLNEVFRLWT